MCDFSLFLLKLFCKFNSHEPSQLCDSFMFICIIAHVITCNYLKIINLVPLKNSIAFLICGKSSSNGVTLYWCQVLAKCCNAGLVPSTLWRPATFGDFRKKTPKRTWLSLVRHLLRTWSKCQKDAASLLCNTQPKNFFECRLEDWLIRLSPWTALWRNWRRS